MKIKLSYNINISSMLFVKLMLVLILYYFSYRYILKYANDVTSETYFATPTYIQIGKYVIDLLLLILFSLYILFRRHIVSVQKNVFICITYLVIHDSYALIYARDQGDAVLLLGLVTILLIILSGGVLKLELIDNILRTFLIYCSVYEVIQILLYFFTGRLPAIAWGNSNIFHVRFGGAFDDPFAFSIILSFFIPYAFKQRTHMWTFFSVILTFFLIITWTLTTIIVIFGLVFWLCVYKWIKNRKVNSKELRTLIMIVPVFILCMSYGGWVFLEKFFSVKMGSMAMHVASFSLNGMSNLGILLGIFPQSHYSEASPIKMLFQCGIVYTVFFYSFGIYCVFIALRNSRMYRKIYAHDNPLLYAIFFYEVCFLISSLNIPYVYQFMPMLLYSIFVGIEFVIYKQQKYIKQLEC